MSAGKRFSGKIAISSNGVFLTATGAAVYLNAGSIGPGETLLLYMSDGGGGLLNGPIQALGNLKWLAYVSDNGAGVLYYGAVADYANAQTFAWTAQPPYAVGYAIQNGQWLPVGIDGSTGAPKLAAFQGNPPSGPRLTFSVVAPGLDAVQAAGGVKSGDFSHVDFSGESLTSLNLHGCNFSYANLRNTIFTGSALHQTTWQRAEFGNTALAGCSLQTADFSNCELTGANFAGCDLRGATFARSTLVNASFRNAVLTAVTFDGADLTGADFTGASAPQSSFAGANLSKVVCGDNTDFYHCNFRNATLRDGRFAGIRMGSGDFRGADLSGSDFRSTDLSHSDFVGGVFAGVDFSGSNLSSGDFTGCDLSAVTASPATRSESTREAPMSFRGAIVPFDVIQQRVWTAYDLIDATVLNIPKDVSTAARPLQASYALMTGLNLSGAHRQSLSNQNWRHAMLDNAVMGGLDFSGSDFTGSSMRQAICTSNFSNATLAGVTAQGAQFGGISQQFTLDLSYVATLNSGQVSGLIPVFQNHGIPLSPGAGLTKLRGLWVVTDGAARYPVVKETSGAAVTITVLGESSFRLDPSLETALNQNSAALLRPAFQSGGVTLSSGAQAALKTAAWSIVDSAGNRTFQVRLDVQSSGSPTLRVYGSSASAQLSGAYMPDANFANANLYGVIASDCQFYGEKSSLQGAILEEATFDGANLGTVAFQEAQMQGIVLTRAVLTNCSLNGANLTAGVSGRVAALDEANLMGADFTDAMLYGVTLNRAAVGVNVPNVPQTSGVCLFTMRSPFDLVGELNRASTQWSLNPDGNPDAFQNGVRALDRQDTATVTQLFAAQGLSLSAGAQITTQATQQVWNILAGGGLRYTVWSALDGNGVFEMFVKPWPAGPIFSLNPDGNAADYSKAQSALNAGDSRALRPYFEAQQHALAPGAAIVQAQQGTVWQVSDIGTSYTVWAGLDSNFAMQLYVRTILTNTAGEFARAGIDLHPQVTVTPQVTGVAWMLDNDSNNPVNFATGYCTFCLVKTGGGIDVYGVTLHVQRLGAGNRLEIAALPCNPTTLRTNSLNPATVCPNGKTLATNQAEETSWAQWMRAPAPPAPPLCVPGAYTYCAPTSIASSR